MMFITKTSVPSGYLVVAPPHPANPSLRILQINFWRRRIRSLNECRFAFILKSEKIRINEITHFAFFLSKNQSLSNPLTKYIVETIHFLLVRREINDSRPCKSYHLSRWSTCSNPESRIHIMINSGNSVILAFILAII